MTAPESTPTASTDAVGAPVERPVRPCAWWHKAENGNIRCWTSAPAESLRLAKEVGCALEPLYDQAALDAAVAADRERCGQVYGSREVAMTDEIKRLRQVWEDTRTQRDELLAHLAGKASLPQWAADWLKA